MLRFVVDTGIRSMIWNLEKPCLSDEGDNGTSGIDIVKVALCFPFVGDEGLYICSFEVEQGRTNVGIGANSCL